MEGPIERNLDLCRRRVRRVASLLSDGQIDSGGQRWAIRAGEYKYSVGGRSASEEEQDSLAESIGEKQLRSQRALIIVAISHQPEEDAAARISEIVKYLWAPGLLPTSYQHSGSAPSAID